MVGVVDSSATSRSECYVPVARNLREMGPLLKARKTSQLRHLIGQLSERTSERSLADFWTSIADFPGSAAKLIVRHPVMAAMAVVAIVRLPKRAANLSDGLEGRAVAKGLSKPGLLGLPVRSIGLAVLDIPQDPGDYLLGSSKQTLRRKMRAAAKRGVTCRRVDDDAERRELLQLATVAEQVHLDEKYRNQAPDIDYLLSYGLWLAAFDAESNPILLSVTPTDSGWGELSYFRTFGSGPAHSDSRYLMMVTLVEALAERGVLHLFDEENPRWLSNGLRQFQRMVGFRYRRVSLTDAS